MLGRSTKNMGLRLGINGVWGNKGVAAVPLVTGVVLVLGNWRLVFLLTGVFCMGYGVIFLFNLSEGEKVAGQEVSKKEQGLPFAPRWQQAFASLAMTTA